MSKIKIKEITLLLIGILAYLNFIYYGFKGIDWGFHWDEGKLFGGISNVVESQILLPGWYNYPSATFWITILATWISGEIQNVPSMLSNNWNMYSLPNHFWVIPCLEYQNLINKIRPIFVVLSSLIGITTYISCRLLGFSKAVATTCSILSLGSFTIFYHSRWITPDPLLMLFGAMTVTLFIWAYKAPSEKKLITLTISAALTLSAKYPGGLFLIYPLIIANLKGLSIKRTITTLTIFTITFVVITPGIILDSQIFYKDITYELHHYKEMGHGIWTIKPGIDHLTRILDFITFRGTGANEMASVLLFLGALLGTYAGIKKNPYLALSILSVPILYTLYFSTQRVMFVRNLLVLIPFFFLFIGYALDYIETHKHKYISFLALLGLALTSGLTSHYKMKGSTNSLYEGDEKSKMAIKTHLDYNKDKNYLISKAIQSKLTINPQDINYIDPIKEESKFDGLICELSELNLRTEAYLDESVLGRYGNKRNLYKVIAGSNEIDLDYYPDWLGKKRYIVIENPIATELAILNPSARWGLIRK